MGILLTGCVGVLPLPNFSNEPLHGTCLTKEDTDFIRVGITTADELFAALGTDCAYDPAQRAVAYSWELPGGRGVYWAIGPGGGGGGEFEWTRWRAFFVAFDTNNVVAAVASKRLSGSRPLHSHLYTWAKQHDAAAGQVQR